MSAILLYASFVAPAALFMSPSVTFSVLKFCIKDKSPVLARTSGIMRDNISGSFVYFCSSCRVGISPFHVIPSSSIFFLASTVGITSALIAPRSAVTASGVFIPAFVIVAIDAPTSLKLTPACLAIGKACPIYCASSGNVVTPSFTVVKS